LAREEVDNVRTLEAARDRTYRFGSFELDAQTGELTDDGRRVRVAWQSIALLRLLIARPGEVVTRDEVRGALWPEGTHVDYDHGLNNAVARLRRALGDAAEAPRFIETIPRVGYRFIGSVMPESVDAPAVAPRWRLHWTAAAAAMFALGLGLGTALPRSPGHSSHPSAATAEARDQAERSLAYTRLVLAGDLASDVAGPAATEASTRALALDPRLADAHLAAGYAALWARWDWDAADRLFRTARALDPESARAHHAHALWLSAHGHHEQALRAVETAAALDPASRDIARDAARLAFMAGNAESAVIRLRLLLARHPDDAGAHELLSQALANLGRNAEAAPHLARFLVLIGVDQRYATDDARRLAAGGMIGLYRWYMSRPSTKPEDRYGVPFKLALSHALIGNADAALEWLQRAQRQRDSRLLFLNVDPRFAPLRGDPRFQALIEQVGL
jgi:DNA-binding winged helix-turn-helix (wHTH) protein/Flp pilus assembly protein TadD